MPGRQAVDAARGHTDPSLAVSRALPDLQRWWIYQRERFPVFKHGLLIVAFSSCAVSFSALLAGGGSAALPPFGSYAVAFVTCFLFFLQLRIADEFKDREEDARYRPYRPVPRGLVRLRELGVVFVLGAIIQLGLAVVFDVRLSWLLVAAWVYLGLMSVEFFARDWLKARPLTYLWTHMLIMPIVDFYATACHWLPEGGGVPNGLKWFLAASFFNGVAIEFGRKIRHRNDEEEGVPTYSRMWGPQRAAVAWLAVLAIAGGCGVLAAGRIEFALPFALMLGAVLVAAAGQTLRFRKLDKPAPASRFETISGIWTLCFYLGLGLLPLAVGRGWFSF